MSVIFWLAVILFCLGVGLLLMPERIMTWGRSMNRIIPTEDFFQSLDGPRYYEPFIYRHHWLSGGVIIVLAAVTIYMLALYTPVDTIMAGIAVLVGDHPFYHWLLEMTYYLLLALNAIAFIIGFVVLLRPSLLKRLESWGNRWIDTRGPLKKLDDEYEVPESILPGRPRWFGLFVAAGAAYMIYMAAPFVF